MRTPAHVTDGMGIVAWVGIGPPKVVGRIVGEVLAAGTCDARLEPEPVRKEEAEAKERAAADIAGARSAPQQPDDRCPGHRDVMGCCDRTAALAALEVAFAADPASEATGTYQPKLVLLLHGVVPDQVSAHGRSLLGRFPEHADVISFASAVLAHMDEGTPRYDSSWPTNWRSRRLPRPSRTVTRSRTRASASAGPSATWGTRMLRWRP